MKGVGVGCRLDEVLSWHFKGDVVRLRPVRVCVCAGAKRGGAARAWLGTGRRGRGFRLDSVCVQGALSRGGGVEKCDGGDVDPPCA